MEHQDIPPDPELNRRVKRWIVYVAYYLAALFALGAIVSAVVMWWGKDWSDAILVIGLIWMSGHMLYFARDFSRTE